MLRRTLTPLFPASKSCSQLHDSQYVMAHLGFGISVACS
jgi:hypothetical protein